MPIPPSKNMPLLPKIFPDYTGKGGLDKGLVAKLGQLNSVCFFMPSRFVGGYEFLFIRFSKVLSSLGLNVYYVDYEDTLASIQLQNTNITMINYQDNMKEINIDEPLHIIAPITWAYQMPCFKNPDSKVYFYNAHPLSSEWTMGRSGMNFRTFVKFIKKLNRHRALCYMDFSCYDSMKRKTKMRLDPIYVPVFNDTLADREVAPSFISDSEINLAWLGRLDTDKVYSVLNLLNNFNQYVTVLKKRIHIIGDGEAKHLIKPEDYPNLDIIFTGLIVTGQLQDYMIKNIDLLFAMGMSLLEGAVLKIPAALTLSSETPLKSKQYIWLHHLNRFTLGIYENHLGGHNCTITNFDDMLDEIYIRKEKEQHSIKAYQYFLKHHSVYNTINRLLSFMCEGSLSYAEYSKVSLHKYDQGEIITFNPLKKLKDLWNRLKKIDEILSINTRLEAHNTRLEAYNTRLEIQNWHRIVSQKICSSVSKGDKIRVAFYVIYKAVFPAHNVFKLMLEDELFTPKIVVIPDLSRGERNREEVLEASYSYYNQLYPEHTILPRSGSEWLDIAEGFDLICSANPHDQLTHHFYSLIHIKYKTILPFYIPYTYNTTKYIINVHSYWDLELLWMYFMDNYYTASYTRGENWKTHCAVTGHPKLDSFTNKIPQRGGRKKIIIAPHHTIFEWKNELEISNFLVYADFFLILPKLYPQIDFVFRPHPHLIPNLQKEIAWGEAKTAEYLKNIQLNPNLWYDDGSDSAELFMNSDAMIHDCGSFLAEYLVTGFPCCYMLRNSDTAQNQLSYFGQKCVSQHYKAYTREDIINFIDNVVIKRDDPLKEQRVQFVKEYIGEVPSNISQLIIDSIKKNLFESGKIKETPDRLPF